MIETRDTHGRLRVFTDWDSLVGVDGQFVSLSAHLADVDQHTHFPPGLQVVHFERCRGGDTLPPLPLTVTSVSFTACQITRWNHVLHAGHEALESLSFTDCILSSLDGDWPPNLVNLSCKGNRLLQIRSDFPPNLSLLDLSNNLFRFPPSVYEHMRQGLTVLFAPNVNCFRDPHPPRPDWNDVGADTHPPVLRRGRLVKNAIVSSTQSVHASSVQDSLSQSVRIILENPRWSPKKGDLQLYDKTWFGFWKRSKKRVLRRDESSDEDEDEDEETGVTDGKDSESMALLQDICNKLGKKVHSVAKKAANRATVHSRAGITYGRLLSHVWNLAADNKDLRDVVGAEILAGEGYCFTGQFSRLVNSLTGFVEGVGVQLSEAESLGNKLARVIGDLQAKYPSSCPSGEEQACYEQDAQTAMVVVFTEEETPEDEWNSWLAGI